MVNSSPTYWISLITHFKYLGNIFNNHIDSKREILERIEQVRSTTQDENFLDNIGLIKIIRCSVLSILYYRMKSWTLKTDTIKRIEAFEMWVYRQMLSISWVERISNNIPSLERMQKIQNIYFTIKEIKLKYLGHVMRNENYYLPTAINHWGKIKSFLKY